MRKLLSFIGLCLTTVVFSTCIKDPIGKWSDNIQLKQKEFHFNPNGDSATIIANKFWWMIECVDVDTSRIFFYSLTDKCNFVYTDSILQLKSTNCNSLFVKLNANNKSTQRKLIISFMAGDYYDGVVIYQDKK